MDTKYLEFSNKLLKDMEIFLISTLSETKLNNAAEEGRMELLKQIEILRSKKYVEPDEYIAMDGNGTSKDVIINEPAVEYVNEDITSETAMNIRNNSGSPIHMNTEYENQSIIQSNKKLECTDITEEPLPLGQINKPSAPVIQSNKRLEWSDIPEESQPLGQINTPSVPALKAMAIKFGPLQRKDRFMFMDQFRRFLVGLYGHHLYFYNNDRDHKPQHVLDITDYTARPAPEATRDSKKKPLCFELMCTGNKTQQFIARTTKDMEQWVAAIRRTNESNSRNALNEGRNSVYDDATDSHITLQKSQRENTSIKSTSEDSDYAIYHDISDEMQLENLYDDAIGQHRDYLYPEEQTYDDVESLRDKIEELGMLKVVDDSVTVVPEEPSEKVTLKEESIVITTVKDESGGIRVITEEKGSVISGIRLPASGSRIRELVRFIEEEGVIKGDECGRRRDEGGGRNKDEGKDH